MKPTLEKILSLCCEAANVRDITGRNRQTINAVAAYCYLASEAGYSDETIARPLGRDRCTVLHHRTVTGGLHPNDTRRRIVYAVEKKIANRPCYVEDWCYGKDCGGCLINRYYQN